MAGNDPTETGGLFVRRRPENAPVHFRAGPAEASPRRRADAAFAHALLAVEVLLCLSLLGPQPLGWLWVGSQVDYLSGEVVAGLLTVMIGCMTSLMLTLVVGKRVDHVWKLVRRAAGHRQEHGALERIFAGSVMVALVGFTFWFLVIQGPAPSIAPTQ